MAQIVQRDFLDPKVLQRLENLPLFARLPMQGSVAGRHRSPHRGSSVEFAEYRKYVPGDDTRRLDWRAYARSDRFYVKEFEADTNLRLCLVVDVSGSMGFSEGAVTKTGVSHKLDYARRLAATLGHIALKQGDAVGLTLASDTVQLEIPPRRRPSHLRLINDALAEAKPGGETGIVEAMHTIAEKVRQRALVVVISDLFVPPEELRPCFEHLRFRKHDAAVFQLFSPMELDFELERPTRFIDLEGGPGLIADATEIKRRYHIALDRHTEQLKDVVRDTSIDFHRVRMDVPYDEVLARFLVGRAEKGRRR